MRATNDTACPSGSQTRPRAEAAIPRSSAGDDRGERRQVRRDGDARHLVEVEQEQRCDPELCGDRGAEGHGDGHRQQPAEPLGKRGRERDHARRSGHGQLEPDRMHEPRVEDEQRQHRRGQDRARRPWLAEQDADEGERGHRPGAQHGGLRTGEHHEEHDHAEAHPEARERPHPQGAGEGHDGSQHHRDVLARDDQQVSEAGRLEVACGDRVELRGIAENEAEQQPRLARREDPLDRAADERPHHLGEPDERCRRSADPLDVEGPDAHRQTAMRQRLREPRIVGDLQGALDAELIAPHRGRNVLVAADPRRFPNGRRVARPLDTPDIDQGVPAVRARLRVLPQRPRQRHGARGETRQQRTVDAGGAEPGPADAAEQDADDQEYERRRRAAATIRPRGRHGRKRRMVARCQPGDTKGIGAAPPGSRGPGGGEGHAPEQDPDPPRPRRDRGGPAVPHEQAGPERGGRERCSPALHRRLTPSPASGGPPSWRGRSRRPRRADRSM